ncbi:velvet factor-domain-containing protein [Aspergillus californicus]
MSGPPSQHWTYLSDGRYTNARTHTSNEDPHRHTAALNDPYQTPQPPRFLYPDRQSNEPTGIQNVSHPRLSNPGRDWHAGSDTNYRFSPTTPASLAQYSIQRSGVSRSTEHAGPSSSYYDVSSRSRRSIGSAGRVNDVDSQYSSSSATFPSPVHSDNSPGYFPPMPPLSTYQIPMHQRHATGMPSGFENLLHHAPTPSPPPPRTSNSSRYHLMIRQQPIAARACGAGDRDRRPVDPPPIIQILLTDFNPGSEADKAILQDPRFAVGCLLFPVHETPWSGSSSMGVEHTGILGMNLDDSNAPGQATPLLSGKAFVSPFYVDEEPDPDTATPHPSSEDHAADTRRNPMNAALHRPPATFFIFSDLSVRTAGLYRLQFRLMNWGAVEDTGQSMPILAEAWSEPFRVYPAKDFPGMRDSSVLAVRLKELGFVELKTRGKGIGKGRRAAGKSDL